MSNQQIVTQIDKSAMEQVLIGGDLSKLTPAQRVQYYRATCESLGLNPLTKPFDYISLKSKEGPKLTLYAKKDAADQLRNIHKVSIDDIDITETEKYFMVKVKGHDETGRSDVEIGVVNKADMFGDLANVQMKAVTKAKRRLTLSLCGLGWLDETEIETIPGAKPIIVDDTGEIHDLVDQKEPVVEGEYKQVEYDESPVPLDDIPDMSLDLAMSETNSKGVKYGDIESNVLKDMYNAISKHEKTEDNVRKMDAIKVILATRKDA
jgi:hypothetical protein